MKTSSELIAEGYRDASRRTSKPVRITVGDIGIKGDVLSYYGLMHPDTLQDLRPEPYLCTIRDCYVDVASTWDDGKFHTYCYKHRHGEFR